MSLAMFVQDASQRAARSWFMAREVRAAGARVARSAGPVVKEAGKFILMLAVVAVIMAGLAALDIAIWIPRFH
jgi:hypothetical protein